jgi:carboxymethylenebutenolidase
LTLKDYVAEEIALDCKEGLLTRREALRRLGLLGIGAAASATLLAACGSDDDDDDAAPATTSGGGADTTSAAAGAVGEEITFEGPRGQLKGAWAAATDPKGALLVIHENRGLSDHIKSLPPRFASEGFSALAVDLLSEEGGTSSLDEGAAQAALGGAPSERLVADLRAGIDELARRAPDAKLGAIGFCFGGGLTWQLLQAGEARLAAAAPFYGPAPDPADFSKAKAAVFAVYAEQDTRVNGSRDRATAALQRAGLVHEVKTYPGVDHAFFNDTGQRYNAEQARQAFTDVTAWFTKYLA